MVVKDIQTVIDLLLVKHKNPTAFACNRIICTECAFDCSSIKKRTVILPCLLKEFALLKPNEREEVIKQVIEKKNLGFEYAPIEDLTLILQIIINRARE